MEVVDGWHSLQDASLEALHCPRCSTPVNDRFGICGYCGENAHQCRQCRAINYGSLDGWLCAECGHSRYGRLEVTLTCAPSPDIAPITNDTQVGAGGGLHGGRAAGVGSRWCWLS